MISKRKYLFGTSILAGILSMAAPSFAQTAPAAPQADEDEVEEIVVTGSRIRRPELSSSVPLSVVTNELIDNKGFANVADAINEQPATGVPISPDGDQAGFGVGRSFINLFNLGSNRTLVLVNGRRFVGANVANTGSGAGAGGQVDISAIPTALVSRIETIQATGGAIYGSDAVAGVINIITNKTFDGVEVNGEYGISEREDGEQIRARVTAGFNFLEGRLNIAGSYEYAETGSISNNDRPRSALQLITSTNPANTSGTDGLPSSIIYENRRVPEITSGGLAFRTAGAIVGNILTIAGPGGTRIPAQFAPDGTLVAYNPGTFISASVASGGDGLNLAPLGNLLAPVERQNATLFSTFEFNDNIRLDGEVFYNKTIASEDFNQPTYNSGLFGGISGALQFSTANPFLTPQARAAILSQPVLLPADPASPGDRIFFLQRASIDVAEPNNLAESETGRVVLNLNGDFEALGRGFAWNVAGNLGRNEGFFQQDGIVQANFLQALNVNRSPGGAIQCADAAARAAGCVPLNLFGAGPRSQAELDYISATFRQDYEIKQTNYEANFGGDLINVPAGTIGFNVGYEYRKEESSFQPNTASRTGIGRSTPIAPLSGEFDTNEMYAELAVPIFGGDFALPFIQSLDLDGSYREVDNSQAGKDEAWSVGLRWKPHDDLLIRASQSQSFRAPAITELFSPRAETFTFATDPCDFRNINSGPNPTARAANCRAEFVRLGLPADFQLTSIIQAASQRATISGNASLLNEIAEQETIGFVYQPSQIDNLVFSFDYVTIELTNAIGNFNLTSILQVCYDLPTPDPAACSRFQRGQNGLNIGGQSLAGQILSQDNAPNGVGPATGFINAGYQDFSGFTVGIEYNIDVASIANRWGDIDLGNIAFDFDLFQTEQDRSSVTGLGFDEVNSRNTAGRSDVRWKLDTTYRRGGFATQLTTRFTGEYERSNTDTIEANRPQTIGDHYLHDLTLAYTFEPTWSEFLPNQLVGRLQIRNLFDAEPPRYTVGAGIYDLIGRYYQVGLTARF